MKLTRVRKRLLSCIKFIKNFIQINWLFSISIITTLFFIIKDYFLSFVLALFFTTSITLVLHYYKFTKFHQIVIAFIIAIPSIYFLKEWNIIAFILEISEINVNLSNFRTLFFLLFIPALVFIYYININNNKQKYNLINKYINSLYYLTYIMFGVYIIYFFYFIDFPEKFKNSHLENKIYILMLLNFLFVGLVHSLPYFLNKVYRFKEIKIQEEYMKIKLKKWLKFSFLYRNRGKNFIISSILIYIISAIYFYKEFFINFHNNFYKIESLILLCIVFFTSIILFRNKNKIKYFLIYMEEESTNIVRIMIILSLVFGFIFLLYEVPSISKLKNIFQNYYKMHYFATLSVFFSIIFFWNYLNIFVISTNLNTEEKYIPFDMKPNFLYLKDFQKVIFVLIFFILIFLPLYLNKCEEIKYVVAIAIIIATATGLLQYLVFNFLFRFITEKFLSVKVLLNDTPDMFFSQEKYIYSNSKILTLFRGYENIYFVTITHNYDNFELLNRVLRNFIFIDLISRKGKNINSSSILFLIIIFLLSIVILTMLLISLILLKNFIFNTLGYSIKEYIDYYYIFSLGVLFTSSLFLFYIIIRVFNPNTYLNDLRNILKEFNIYNENWNILMNHSFLVHLYSPLLNTKNNIKLIQPYLLSKNNLPFTRFIETSTNIFWFLIIYIFYETLSNIIYIPTNFINKENLVEWIITMIF